MSHQISVFVGPAANLRQLVRPDWAGKLYASPWCPHGPALLPLVGDEEDPGYVAWQPSVSCGDGAEGARALGPALDYWAREASAGAALAYLETNYLFSFSLGYQFAAAWVDGARTYGPATAWAREASPGPPTASRNLLRRLRDRLLWRTVPPAAPVTRRETSPISEALVRLGVAPSGDEGAFAAYGLGSVRHNGDFARTWTALPLAVPPG